MTNLTTTQQEYIKAVYELAGGDEGTHVSHIAQRLGVNKATASVAVKLLQRKKLLRRDTGRKVYLTEQGMLQAACIAEKRAVIKCFLTEILKVGAETADRDAYHMKYLISPQTCWRLHDWIGSSCSIRRTK